MKLSRILRRTLYVKCGILFALGIGAFAFYLRLAAGPVSLESFVDAVEDALASRIGPGWTVTIGDTALELFGSKPAVRTTSLEIRNPRGVVVVRSPYAIVSLDPVSLLTGTMSPREIELRDLQLRATIAKDGTLSFAPQDEASAPAGSPPVASSPPASPPSNQARDAAKPSVVSAAVASLLDPLVESGLIGSLDRATIVGARLTLVGSDGRERVAFPKVGAIFERVDAGDRRIDVDLVGQNGEWTVRGRVGHGPNRTAELEIAALPLADLMLLTGLSAVPIGSDLTLSGRLSSASEGGRLARLEGRFDSSRGSLTRAGHPPVSIGRAAAQARWDESRSALSLELVEVQSEGTEIRLTGELGRIDGGADWRLKVGGRDIRVAGLRAADPIFRIDALDFGFTFNDAGILLDRGSAKGDALDVAMSGVLVPTPAGLTLRGLIEARGTDVRRLVRLWPDELNPGLRGFLATRLTAGVVDQLRLTATFDPTDFRAAFSDAPFTDGALDLKFTASRADLAVVDGLPPLRGLAIEGQGTGTKVLLAARDGFIAMPDGRKLVFTNAKFAHRDVNRADSLAQISFRVSGGADAFASLLRSPIVKDAGASLEMDPATVRGTADLRFAVQLAPGRIPKPADLPMSIAGSVSGLAVEKLPGGEKLDSANLSVSYESGALAVKGEGRIGGSPATFDLQASRGGSSDLVVNTVMDEAARNRRSLPVGPLLAGPIPVKVAIDLTKKTGTRVEADLSRASIDGLVPGWIKPAGKPGRLSFTLGDGDAPELRDFAVDSGSVQMRGQVALSPGGGGVERADLTTFRLSPGDDLRVQVERGPSALYRIAIKGNNGDVRPVLKWMTTAPVRASTGRESHDVDLDVSLNILSGFNDEAMTGVSAKVGSRGGELRSLQFGGRFRTATVEAQLAKRDASAPILAVRSGDAGATLRFLDLYRRMAGGRLAIDGRSGDGVQQGRITIDDFGLKGEPALARIVSQATQRGEVSDERGLAPIARSEVDQVLFNKLQADFRRSGSRIEYSDTVMYGPQVGFSLYGSVDHARDRVDIAGTFVPAYVLNNALSQLPVVGVLLTGGRNEGLFAVDFKVAGALSNPTLTVNPLTAVAPGILRKLFGWMLTPDGREPTEAALPAPARQRRGAR